MNEIFEKIVLKPFISRKRNFKEKWTKNLESNNLMSKSLTVNSQTRNLKSVKKLRNFSVNNNVLKYNEYTPYVSHNFSLVRQSMKLSWQPVILKYLCQLHIPYRYIKPVT